MNIYGDDTTLYRFTPKTQNDKSLIGDLFCGPTLATQWMKKKRVGHIQFHEHQLLTFLHRMLNIRHSGWMGVPTGFPRSLSLYCNLNSAQTSSTTSRYDQSLTMVDKWSAPCNASASSWQLLLFFKTRSSSKCITGAIYVQGLPCLNFLASIVSKRVSVSLWVANYTLPHNPVFADRTTLASRCSIAISMVSFQIDLPYLILLALTITAKIQYATNILANHPLYIRIPLLRCRFHSSNFFPQT